MVHRDYTSNASVQVMLFKDRLEIWNPGHLPLGLTVEQLKQPHNSIPANPLLAEPMYLAGYIERMGTGTRDIVKLCQEAGLIEPEFIQEEFFRVVLWRKKVTTGQDTPEVTPQVTPEVKLVNVLENDLSKKEILLKLRLSDEKHFRNAYLMPAIEKGLVEMTIPDKPTSKNQKYRLTGEGKKLRENMLSTD